MTFRVVSDFILLCLHKTKVTEFSQILSQKYWLPFAAMQLYPLVVLHLRILVIWIWKNTCPLSLSLGLLCAYCTSHHCSSHKVPASLVRSCTCHTWCLSYPVHALVSRRLADTDKFILQSNCLSRSQSSMCYHSCQLQYCRCRLCN